MGFGKRVFYRWYTDGRGGESILHYVVIIVILTFAVNTTVIYGIEEVMETRETVK